ncbi:hypothetical protein C5167_030891 [Papaver somniferum]|uniref:uncharacterized protein LOC113334975 n=1 Tax=Papaver somniferum TaxID=3469 RepID=UPI000E6F5F8C|nr:uncharacterized protein LOC113334975 [Papaver somniferum]RZC89200.1 hypothetical protein C5167_030891 [Papaver somniferum]
MESVSYEQKSKGNCIPDNGTFYEEMKDTVVYLYIIKPIQEVEEEDESNYFTDGDPGQQLQDQDPKVVEEPESEKLMIGTGVIIEGGYILTAAHIVNGNSSVSLRHLEGSNFIHCKVIYIDTNKDLALLERRLLVEGSPMKYVNFGKLEEIKTGRNVYCISNAGSNRGTFTIGYISIHRRLIESKNRIQISNNLHGYQRGSIGAPVFSSRGLLIGIFAKGDKPYDLAIPIDTVKEFVEDFEKEQGSKQGKEQRSKRRKTTKKRKST